MNEPRPADDAQRVALVLVGIGLLVCGVAAFRLIVGSSMGWPSGENARLLWEDRTHRLMLGLVVGAALSVGGVALQALLRNPLAEPFILGLSTGAGLGVMVQWWVVYELGMTLGASHVGAMLGAGASMAIVYFASRRAGGLDPIGLLLTGVVLSTINGALIMAFNLLAGEAGVKSSVALWMMGFLDTGLGAWTNWGVAVVVGGVIVLLLLLGRSMDAATLSDDEAGSVGVNLPRLRVLLFASASVLAAGAVVLAGPIAFVGLICPHLARLLVGPGHGPLIVASALLGGALVVLADTVSAVLALTLGIGTMPIGIFTALLGGPAFLVMLHPRLGRVRL